MSDPDLELLAEFARRMPYYAWQPRPPRLSPEEEDDLRYEFRDYGREEATEEEEE